MKWLLIYRDETLGNAWRNHFADRPDVEVLQADIYQIECDAVVSPANSFGFMDGQPYRCGPPMKKLPSRELRTRLTSVMPRLAIST